jgi:hypothetical protein
MFNNWYLVKLDYVWPVAPETKTKIQAYESLTDAKSVFQKLELGYQLGTLARLRGDKLIKVTGVWLYESFKFHLDEAVDAVKSGNADLLYEAHGIEIDIED